MSNNKFPPPTSDPLAARLLDLLRQAGEEARWQRMKQLPLKKTNKKSLPAQHTHGQYVKAFLNFVCLLKLPQAVKISGLDPAFAVLLNSVVPCKGTSGKRSQDKANDGSAASDKAKERNKRKAEQKKRTQQEDTGHIVKFNEFKTLSILAQGTVL
jgi:hypothetical protein